jgi:TRAP-type C4-dicarboxylate transport system permease large subunit
VNRASTLPRRITCLGFDWRAEVSLKETLALLRGKTVDREGYDKAFTAALIACASTMANLIPPSIMAVVYGATGNVSIGGLFLGGVVPGVLVGIGLMIFSHFFGPTGLQRKRSSLLQIGVAARESALPMVIPFIILGGILTGWFTPT